MNQCLSLSISQQRARCLVDTRQRVGEYPGNLQRHSKDLVYMRLIGRQCLNGRDFTCTSFSSFHKGGASREEEDLNLIVQTTHITNCTTR